MWVKHLAQGASISFVVLLVFSVGGALVAISANQLGLLSKRDLVVVAIGAGLAVAAIASRRPKSVLLCAWVISLTYNRQFYSFDAITGNNGPAGLYWIVADVFLVALLVLWGADAMRRRGAAAAGGMPLWPWYLPYAIACVMSVAAAERMDWALFELVRTAKFAIVLIYVARRFGREEWWTALAAMGAAAIIQAGLGTMEVVTKHSGVLWIFGLQDNLTAVPQMFKDEAYYGWTRATATMAHPPNLACYLLLAVPPFLALALAARDRRLRVGALAASAVGLVGLACTLSRWPAFTMVLQIIALAAALLMLREVSLKRIIAVSSLCGFGLMVVLLPFSDFIADRASRDFERSVNLRAKEFAIAGKMLSDHPVLGVGLNNYSAHLVAYGSELRWGMKPKIANLATQVLHVRYISGPLNAFLLVAAETGMAGLLGFLIWCLATIVVGLYALRRTRGPARIASVGLLVGICGVYFQQTVDYSYWVDPVLYTMALAAAMLARAPGLFPASEQDRKEA